MLFEGTISATGTYNFLEEINTNYTFLNIITVGMGSFKLRLADYISPIDLIINGHDGGKEYIVSTINKSNTVVRYIAIDGVFQAEIKKIYLSNI